MKIGMIILAAGFSSRMGVLKPLLPVGGASALIRAVSTGRAQKIHLIAVVTGHERERVEAELLKCRAKNIRHAFNAAYAQGMFTSVATGVHALPGDLDGFFLLPTDHCAVRPDTIEKLIAAFILTEGRAVIYPTCGGQRGHPPLIPYAFAAGVRDYAGDGGMRGYLEPYPCHEVETDDAGILLDMDTPADYAALLRHLEIATWPDEKASAALLKKYDVPAHIADHGRRVCALALNAAGLLRPKGVVLNEPLLASACLLHDMARTEPDHAAAAARLLLAEGWPDTALLVADHMDLPASYTPRPDERGLLYLADKLERGGRTVSPAETLAAMERRFSDSPEALHSARKRLGHAQAILDALSRDYGISFGDLCAGLPERGG